MAASSFADIEQKWRQRWEDQRLYEVREDDPRPPYYCLDMFPYPSGSGLHVGHWRGYVLSDVYARYHLLKGHKVLHPMGWDAFGAPAEDHAIKTGTHPRDNTVANINNIRRQLKEIGACYDWSREVDTTDPAFYKWTQWIFLKWFEKGLVYRDKAPVNWCATCQAVLTNEEARQLPCGRGGCNLTTRELVQWKVRITHYADRLLSGLDDLDWPQKVKTMQRNWIGKSHGARVRFLSRDADGAAHDLDIFTTRADTLFGATYMVLAPEHPLVDTLTAPGQKEAVAAYRHVAASRSEFDRMTEDKDKTGVALGAVAINPVNGEEIPLFIADYVLMGYGTGAIMAVPAHDERDHAFAQKHGLPIRQVIAPAGGEMAEGCFSGEGVLVNSGDYTGLGSQEAVQKIATALEQKGLGELTVQYRLRDWLFSRQRYWGEPIPIIICEHCGEVGVPEDQLPVTLPDVESYQPTHTGESPLANIADWVNVACPKCSRPAKRETNTMPTWAGSSWYFLRYCDPHNDKALADPEKLKHWMPVDLYVGGVEHAILHLLYARFYTKFLFDIGVVNFEEPFRKLFNQGMITRKSETTGELLKMSKSKGNVVNPDDLVEKYGADTIRLYELFIGPPEAESEWSDAGVEGVYRFLKRAHAWVGEVAARPAGAAEPQPQCKRRHRLVREFEERLHAFRTNTLVSTVMEYLNDALALEKEGQPASRDTALVFARVLAPMAPHLAEEMHEMLGGTGSIFLSSWPVFDQVLSYEDTVTIAVQINGKMRATFDAPRDTDKDTLEKTALSHEKVLPWLEGKTPKKVVVVPGRIVNIVV